ncbi:MAG: CBS domain-containing protein [Deltaproteobacteria bacterium]|nr:CBS domain-containing protein [Deltaproteobacteria bacterium]
MTVSAARPDVILPFSGRVGEVDYRPVRVVPRTCTVADASRYFAASDIDYLVLHDHRIPIGVVNKLDLLRRNMTRPIEPSAAIAELMTTQVITVQEDEPVLESLLFMIRHQVDFLLIMRGREVVGIVGQQDWLSLQTQYPTQLVQKIASASSIDALAGLRSEANAVVWRNFETKGDAVSLTGIVTLLNDAITRRAISLCVQDLVTLGRGEPPAPFAWIGMGSEGRSAQTVTTDQDNGLVYQDVPDDDRPRVDAWFGELAQRVVTALEVCGFQRCEGNAMATNPDLRGTQSHWEKLFERIVTTSDDKDLFEACIYFDFRYLFGKQALVGALRAHLTRTIAAHPFFLRHLVETTVQGTRPPLRQMRWRLYALTGIAPPPFDLKKCGLMPLDSAVRVLALRDGVEATATLQRLQHCLENGRISKSLADDVRKAFDFLLRLRFKLEFSAAHDPAGRSATEKHLVDLRTLPPAQARYLVDALATVLRLQERVYEQIVGRPIHWSVR